MSKGVSNKLLRTSFLLGLPVVAATLLAFQNCSNATSASSTSTIAQSSAFPDSHPADDVTFKLVETTYDPILADRHYIEALLKDVFGPSALAVDTWRIERDSADFGSPCSLYEPYRDLIKGKLTVVDASDVCKPNETANYLGASIFPKPSVTRQALVMKACTDLVQNQTTLKYALSRVSTVAIPSPTDDNLRKLFHLFYRAKPAPPAQLIQSLQNMFDPTNVTLDSWSSVVYTVCASNQWQML